MYKQVRGFDTSKGGSVPNYCLDNVRRGYGISNLYGSAWEAWEHTEQHPDRNIPDGVDVPLFYSYTVTLDNITQNYGHINVRLKNGTVWSDGNIYASIDDYTSKKLPKFVGWGESINEFKIIERNDMTKGQAEKLSLYLRLLDFESVEQANTHTEDDVSHMLADPGYAAALAEAIYRGGNWQDANNKKVAYEKGQTAPITVIVNNKEYVEK